VVAGVGAGVTGGDAAREFAFGHVRSHARDVPLAQSEARSAIASHIGCSSKESLKVALGRVIFVDGARAGLLPEGDDESPVPVIVLRHGINPE
jgi:hypothetical protein